MGLGWFWVPFDIKMSDYKYTHLCKINEYVPCAVAVVIRVPPDPPIARSTKLCPSLFVYRCNEP